MRLIDAERLKAVLEKNFGHTGGASVLEQLIDEQPTIQPEPHWIPVSERLPEKAEGRYWVCTNTGYQCQCRWTDDVYGLGSNGKWEWKIFDIPQYSYVIAWMPLPEPYKERRTDEKKNI